MNTILSCVVCLTVAQIQPSQFDPGQAVSPVQPVPIGDQSSPADSGGAFRLTDQLSDPPMSPAVQERDPPTPLRPDRDGSTTDRSRATANGGQTVRPVGSETQPTPSEALAAMILAGAIELPDADGTDVALVDLLRRVSDNNSRKRAVQSYWRLGLAIAEQNFARYEMRYLAELPMPQSPLDESLLTAELTQARAREAAAVLKVLELQEDLMDASRLELTAPLRPVDRPFVGSYRTDFETLFANRPAPVHLKRIDRRLPYQLEVIARRAEAVAAGERAALQLADAYNRGAAGLSAALDALARLSRTRRELLDVVLSYNEQIAEYSFAVVRPSLPTESLLGTLIPRDAAAPPAMLADANVRPASAEASVLEAGEVDGAQPLRPLADPQSSLRAEPVPLAPSSQSILKRVTIDHP